MTQQMQLTRIVCMPIRQALVLPNAGRNLPKRQPACSQIAAYSVIRRDGCCPQGGIAIGIFDPLSSLFCFALMSGLLDVTAHRRQFGRRLVPCLADAPVTAEVLTIVAKHAPKAIGEQFGPARLARTKAIKSARF